LQQLYFSEQQKNIQLKGTSQIEEGGFKVPAF